jgi:primosomal protein N' (replication factor Y)
LISDIAPHLGKEVQRANILEVLQSAPDHRLPLDEAMELAGSSTRSAINNLIKNEDIVLEPDSKFVRLNLPSGAVRDRIIELRGGQLYLDILYVLAEATDSVDVGEIYQQVEKASTQHLYRLEDDGLIVLGEDEVLRDPLEGETFTRKVAPPLTEGQQQVWDVIRDYMEGIHWRGATPDPDSPHVFLIHGVTGSGKTEIYMRAVDQAMAQGRQSIVLVPEIALTVQLVKRFAERFKGQMSVIHSGLSPGERYDTWRRARAGEIDLIVGARSALFAPLPDIGLVVLDEEHDDSYKQGPPIMPPYYHAREVAIEAMRQNRGTVILGSATPDIQTWYRAERGDFVLLELPHRVLANREKIEQQTEQLNLESARYIPTEVEEAVSIVLPPVQVVDMRQELQAGNVSVFSRALKSALENVLNANEQALLFLNRRGTSTFVMCRDCGTIVKCKRCDTPLTYHADQGELTCHYCGHSQPNPAVCPACGSHKIKHFGTGTEKIDQALRDEFPAARVLRWDRDTSSERGAHGRILETFTGRQADILVGTQMIAKGLDIPLVTLVGIISGDTALGLPDFRSSERTFQLLTQVAGRAGRGLLGGRVILQTYHPQNYAIQAAAEHDYHRFYEREITFRQMNQYPPYSRLTRLLFTDSRRSVVEQEASTVAEVLRVRQKEENFSATEVVGPTPCFFTRLNNIFRWQILVRSSDPVAFLAGMEFSSRVMIDIDPVDLL